MTTNDSGKLNMGGVDAIKDITGIPPNERTPQQSRRLAACLTPHRPFRCCNVIPSVDSGLKGQTEPLPADRVKVA